MKEKKAIFEGIFLSLRKFGRLLFCTLALFSLFLLALSWAGPFLLERGLAVLMVRAGIESPEVTVESLTPWRLQLSDIRGQQGRLGADYIAVHFSPAGLLRGKIDRIVAVGVVWHIIYRDGEIDLGLPVFDRDEASSDPPQLPFESLAVKSSSIVLHRDGLSLRVPLGLLLEADHGQEVKLDFLAEPFGIPVLITGQGNLATSDAMIHGRFPGRPADVGIWAEGGGRQAVPVGTVDFKARWHRPAGTAGYGKFDFTTEIREFFWDALGLQAKLDKGTFALHCAIDEDLLFSELDGSVDIDGLRFQEYELDGLTLSLGKQGRASSLRARLKEPLRATVTADGKHTGVNEFLKGNTFDGRFACTLEGFVPPDFVSRSSDAHIAAVSGVPVQASGTLAVLRPEGSDWRIEGQVLKSLAGPAPFFLTGQNIRIEQAFLRAVGRFKMDRSGLEGCLDDGSVLGARKIIRHDENGPAVVEVLEIGSRRGRNLLSYSAKPGSLQEISAAAVFRKPVTARLENMKFHAGTLSLGGRAWLAKDGPLRWQGCVELGKGSFEVPENSFRVEDITVSLPFSKGTRSPERGHFSVGRLLRDRLELPGPAGRIAIHDNRLSADGGWQFLSSIPLAFQAILDMSGPLLNGSLQAEADWFEMPDQKALARLAPDFDDLNLAGQGRLKANISLEGPLLIPDVSLSLRDVAVTSRRRDLEVSGLSGSVRVERLVPFSSPGNQVLTVDRLRLGALEAEKGFLAFRLEDHDRLFLEKMHWSLPQGGTLTAQAARFDLGTQQGEVEVLLDKIDLVALLARLTDGKIGGSGLVYGRIPLSYAQGKVRLDTGYVHALPGTGRLGIRDEEWLKSLMYYINEAMAGHPYLALVAERMEEALRDFQYHYLTVDLKRRGRETAARVELRGRGVKGDPPQEIGALVLNINDLDELINRVLGFKMTSGESIDRALEDLLDFQ